MCTGLEIGQSSACGNSVGDIVASSKVNDMRYDKHGVFVQEPKIILGYEIMF